LLFLLAMLSAATRDAAAVSTCTTACAQTACTVGCDEGELRDAVAKANDCLGNAAWTDGRSPSSPGRRPARSRCRTTSPRERVSQQLVRQRPEAYSVCLRNDGIRIRGGMRPVFVGSGLCRQCTDECPPPQPGLFTLKGNNDELTDFTYRYFPEGLHVRLGSGHTIARVTNDRICEDAVTLDITAGTGNTLADSTFIGNQPAEPGHTCLLPNDAVGPCGTDKAIQLNGGGVTIVHNTITSISQPVHAQAGEHVLLANTSAGSASDDNLCQSYTVTGPAKVTMSANKIDRCKFGVRVDGTAFVSANGNVITNPWVAASTSAGPGACGARATA
jgi:hypothetical protein